MNIFKKIVNLYNKQSTAKKYFLLSCFVTVVDYFVLTVLHRGFGVELIAANTAGVITGFALHYAMGSNTVFKTQYGVAGFLVYLSTFLVGLLLANTIIKISVMILKEYTTFSETIMMTIGKMASIVIPYFVLYYMRILLFSLLRKLNTTEEKNT